MRVTAFGISREAVTPIALLLLLHDIEVAKQASSNPRPQLVHAPQQRAEREQVGVESVRGKW